MLNFTNERKIEKPIVLNHSAAKEVLNKDACYKKENVYCVLKENLHMFISIYALKMNHSKIIVEYVYHQAGVCHSN